MRFRLITLAAVLVLSAAASACKLLAPLVICESNLVWGLTVRLADSASGEPVIVDSIFATATTSGYADTVTYAGGLSWFSMVEDRAGTYLVDISVPGYARWQRVGVEVVMEDRCHVETQTLPVSLHAEPPRAAVAHQPQPWALDEVIGAVRWMAF